MSRNGKVSRLLTLIPVLRWIQWLLLAGLVLLLVAGLPEWADAMVAKGQVPRGILLLPAILFGLSILALAVNRMLLVRAGKYSPAKALAQVGLGVLVLTMLMPANVGRYKSVERASRVELTELIRSENPVVRAVACEALASRAGPDPAKPIARALASEDPDARVRAACGRVR